MEIEIVNSVSKLLPFEANEGINHESGPYTIMRDSETAFENAIKNGLNAEEYMYMYSDEKVDYFKHINTRKYEKIDYKNEL